MLGAGRLRGWGLSGLVVLLSMVDRVEGFGGLGISAFGAERLRAEGLRVSASRPGPRVLGGVAACAEGLRGCGAEGLKCRAAERTGSGVAAGVERQGAECQGVEGLRARLPFLSTLTSSFSGEAIKRQLIAGVAVTLFLITGDLANAAPAANPATKDNAAPVEKKEKVVDQSPEARKARIEERTELFKEILKDLDEGYVDPVDIDKLTETGFNAMLTSLDPFTEFENNNQAEQMRVQTFGNYGGVGLVISKPKDSKGKDGDYISVMDAFEGFAWDQGMRAGDTLTEIDGKDVKTLGVSEVSEMLKGEPGSVVKLKYTRPGVDKVLEKELMRKVVLLRDVPLGMFVGPDEDKIGYIKLQGFSSNAATEMAYIMSQLQAKGELQSLILDLRGNPGGLLNSAIKVSDLFLEEGAKIVSTKGRTIQDSNDKGNKFEKGLFETSYSADPITVRVSESQKYVFHPPLLSKATRVVVLVDKFTASAAEIVSGALQDHDRAVIIGETTYGKGLVQQLQKLGNGGSKIKYTIGKYYTPSGRCIQSKTYAAAGPGTTGTKAVEIKDTDRKVFYTDSGRKVRDAGGIEPDVKSSSPKVGQLARELDVRELFYKYASKWQAAHTADGESLANADAPLVTEDVYKDFQAFVKANTPEQMDTPFDKSLDVLKEAIEETGYKDALGDVSNLKKHLNDILMDEFNKDEASIRKRLELSIRQRYLADSILLSMKLKGDPQMDQAVVIAKDAAKYAALTNTKAPSGSIGLGAAEAK